MKKELKELLVSHMLDQKVNEEIKGIEVNVAPAQPLIYLMNPKES